MSNFVKDLSRVGLSNIIIMASGLLTSIITARSIGPSGNGIIAGLSVYPSLFMTIGSLGIRQSTAYYIGKGIYDEDKVKQAVVNIWLLTTILSISISYLLMKFFSKSGDNDFWVLLSLVPIPFNLFVTYNSGIFLGKNDLKTFNRVNWIPPLFILLTTILLVLLLNWGVSGALIAVAIGPIIMSIIMLFKNDFIKAFTLKIQWSIIKSLLSLGVIYALSLLVINLNYKADTILLDRMSDAYQLGIYNKGAVLTQYLWQIPMVLSTVVFARSAVAKDDYQFSLKVCQLLRISIIIIGLASIILCIFSKFIITLLFGENFRDSALILQFLLPGVLILTIFKVINMDLAGKGKPWVAMKAMVPSLFINVLLNILFIPKYGAAGSALCSTISYGFAGISFLHFYSKEIGVPVKIILAFKPSDFNFFINFWKKRKNGNKI
ncbi:polysaccharide biosynthesis C-terminal domain-containing protein [Sphingobacterium sp.]|uniref:oligosaccharide flippase family protein n=1 Tax=Sphingobacterium sp. TaxID=341027 RepID=UPI0028B25C76|nr:polysaccharide biosynthesis C-terminal domain-containing protein [Sphingobacterium sp.]